MRLAVLRILDCEDLELTFGWTPHLGATGAMPHPIHQLLLSGHYSRKAVLAFVRDWDAARAVPRGFRQAWLELNPETGRSWAMDAAQLWKAPEHGGTANLVGLHDAPPPPADDFGMLSIVSDTRDAAGGPRRLELAWTPYQAEGTLEAPYRALEAPYRALEARRREQALLLAAEARLHDLKQEAGPFAGDPGFKEAIARLELEVQERSERADALEDHWQSLVQKGAEADSPRPVIAPALEECCNRLEALGAYRWLCPEYLTALHQAWQAVAKGEVPGGIGGSAWQSPEVRLPKAVDWRLELGGEPWAQDDLDGDSGEEEEFWTD